MNRVQISFISSAQDNEDLLTEWEVDFISSLAGKDEDYELSDKQNSILNRITQKINTNDGGCY